MKIKRQIGEIVQADCKGRAKDQNKREGPAARDQNKDVWDISRSILSDSAFYLSPKTFCGGA